MTGWLFYLPLALVFYQFVVFPLLLFSLARRKPERTYRELSDEELPTLTVLIAARNEERSIAAKLRNCLKLRYPKEKLRFIVVANGCTDRTPEIVRGFAGRGIELLEYGEVGKTVAQNLAVRECDSDVIVFSDANNPYNLDGLYELAKPFQDPQVGSVAGVHYYFNTEQATGATEGTYMTRIETLLKVAESRFGATLGAAGSIYAVRRSAYIPLPPDVMSDFWEPVLIAARGWRSEFTTKALAFERAHPEFEGEFRRKVRIIHRAVFSMLRFRWMLNPFRHTKLAVLFFSHKLLRWFDPFLLIAAFLSAVVRILAGRGGWLERSYFLMVTTLGFVALLGRGLGRERAVPGLSHAYYAFLMMAAALKGTVAAFRQGSMSSWDHGR